MDPTGQCLFVENQEGFSLPLMTESSKTLPKIQKTISGKELFVFPPLKCILAGKWVSDEYGAYFEMENIHIKGAQQQIKLQEAFKSEEKEAETRKPGMKHWLNHLEWMFIKFPCEDILSEQQLTLHFSVITSLNTDLMKSHVHKRLDHIIENLKKTRKPLKKLPNVSQIQCFDISGFMSANKMFKKRHCVTQGDFVQIVTSYLPIQVARCQSNEFLVLKQGNPLPIEEVSDFSDMLTIINFGLLESIIFNWNGPVKVVSSMGKQTTAKSYRLNHLVGSSFNISGKRCTDGCWMTIKRISNCLYVILDFEGIGSFERTDQDDLFLSLLNSALSTITIIKTEQRLDKDTDHLFAKFNMSSA